MPDNELSLILLVHVLNKHLQKNLAFLAHSKLPLTTVLADFVSTLTNYEKAFDHPPQNSTLNALDLSEIIEKSALKTSFTINPENGGELVFLSPIKQIQSTLLNVVVESSVKYGKSLLGQLQGLKDEYHTNSLENESIVEPSKPVSEVLDQTQGSENETSENSANIILEGARKTESPLESGPAEEDEMEVDVENVEQDSTPIEPVQEAAEIEPEITLDVETKKSLEPEEIKEIDVEVHKSEDPQSEEVEDEEVQDTQEIEAEADQEEEAGDEEAAEEAEEEEEEEEAEEEADEASEIEPENAILSEPQAMVETEAENVENKEEKDEDEEVVNDENIDHEETEENIPKTEGEAENSSSDDEEENSSSREGDDLVSDEIERSSRLLLEESERDQEEVDHIEKPQLADVDIDTEAETLDHGEKEEEEQVEEQEEEEKEEEDSKDDAKQGELEAVSIPNKETKEELVQDPESEHVETTNTETTVPELVGSEPLGEKPETPVTEKERDNVTEENEEQPSQESQEIQEPEPEPAPKAKPQEKSKPVPPSTRRKRKIEETLQEPVQPETPKKPRKAKETSVASRRKSTASEQILTPAQKYKRFQNIAINFIKSIEAHRCSSPFLTAITAPEYTLVVKQPQDLKTIMKNVKKRHDLAVYTTVKELERDVMLMFTNCVMFNKSSIPLVKMAQEMKEDVRNTFKMFEDTEKGLA